MEGLKRRPNGYWGKLVSEMRAGDKVTVKATEASSVYRIGQMRGIILRAFDCGNGMVDIMHCGTRKTNSAIKESELSQIAISHEIKRSDGTESVSEDRKHNAEQRSFFTEKRINQHAPIAASVPLRKFWFHIDEETFQDVIEHCKRNNISTGRFFVDSLMDTMNKQKANYGNV